MANFESRETEEYFYKMTSKHGIQHVSWQSKVIVTKDDIDRLIRSITGEKSYEDDELYSEPFMDAP